MIDPLKSDDIVRKVGGRFKLTALVQHRWRELLSGDSRPLVDRKGRSDLEIAVQEVLEDKVTIDFSNSDLTPADKALS